MKKDKDKNKSGYTKTVQALPKDWEHRHGWYYYADIVRHHPSSNPKYSKRNKPSTVYHCESCNKQWQYKWVNPKTKERTFDFYSDLPTLGLKRKTCYYCKEIEEKGGKKIKKYFGLL